MGFLKTKVSNFPNTKKYLNKTATECNEEKPPNPDRNHAKPKGKNKTPCNPDISNVNKRNQAMNSFVSNTISYSDMLKRETKEELKTNDSHEETVVNSLSENDANDFYNSRDSHQGAGSLQKHESFKNSIDEYRKKRNNEKMETSIAKIHKKKKVRDVERKYNTYSPEILIEDFNNKVKGSLKTKNCIEINESFSEKQLLLAIKL